MGWTGRIGMAGAAFDQLADFVNEVYKKGFHVPPLVRDVVMQQTLILESG